MSEATLVEAFWGGTVDTSGHVWVLDNAVKIRFPKKLDLFDRAFDDVWLPDDIDIEGALKGYIRKQIRTCAAVTVLTDFRSLMRCLSFLPVVIALRFLRNGALLIEAYDSMRDAGISGNSIAQHLGTLRKWYLWAADEDYGFCPEEAAIYSTSSISGGERGRAVLRQDPNQGPLSDSETERVEASLWAAVEQRTLDSRYVCAALLMFYLGCNPENLRRLRNSDLVHPSSEGDAYELRVPRIKKGHADKRAAFKSRPLTNELGRFVAEVVAANRRSCPDPDGSMFTLLRRGDRAQPAQQWFFGSALSVLRDEFGLKADNGEPLRLSPRRLRYSFATRCVAAGMSEVTLMGLLDHSNLSTVMVYFDGRLGLVERLDRVLGEALRPLAAMFLEEPKSAWSPVRESHIAVAPLACLDCSRFRPIDPEALRRLGASISATVSATVGVIPQDRCKMHAALGKRAFEAATACEAFASLKRKRREGTRRQSIQETPL